MFFPHRTRGTFFRYRESYQSPLPYTGLTQILVNTTIQPPTRFTLFRRCISSPVKKAKEYSLIALIFFKTILINGRRAVPVCITVRVAAKGIKLRAVGWVTAVGNASEEKKGGLVSKLAGLVLVLVRR